MPAATRQRRLVPSTSASPAALFDCHWDEVRRFLQQANADGSVPDHGSPEGWWEAVPVVVDHGDRIEWRRLGRNCFGDFDDVHQLYRRDCCSCHTPTAGLHADGLTQCRSCRLKYSRQKGREYTARWRYKQSGELPAWAAGSKPCAHCGATFTPKRSTAQFCSTACRVAAHRAKNTRQIKATPRRFKVGSFMEANPPNGKRVMRGSRWGNPFRVGIEATTAAEAVALFRDHLGRHPELVELARRELRGFDLGCTCPPDQPCHADVWLELANS